MSARRIQDSDLTSLATRYEAGESSHVLAKAFGVDVNTVLKWIRSTGTAIRTRSQAGLVRIPSKRTYRLDESVFDTITEESAYWVGFLMADGCVRHRRHGQKTLMLGLCEKDLEHVKKFAAFLGTDRPIKLQVSSQVRTNGEPRLESRFEIASNRIADALARFGVVPQKSRTAKVIGLESNRDFWRGVVDGDGHLRLHKRRTTVLTLCGSENLMRQFFDWCGTFLPGIQPKAYYPMKGPLWIVHLNGENASRAVEVMYGDCTVALDRKNETAQEIIRRWSLPLLS